jgi:hypothetical protein
MKTIPFIPALTSKSYLLKTTLAKWQTLAVAILFVTVGANAADLV